MARSRWKLVYFSFFLWKKILILKKKNTFKNRRFVYYGRSSSAPFCLIGKMFRIHKGLNFRRFSIGLYTVGYKFGSFSFTRKPFHFPLRKMQKRKNIFFRK